MSIPSRGRCLIANLERSLQEIADPERARGQQAYMKSEMPYWGVKTPDIRRICKKTFAQHPLRGFEEWRRSVLGLWRGAKRREERHCAIELSGAPAYRQHRTLRSLPIFEEMIVTGAWWDSVDAIASHRLRELLESAPRGMSRRMRIWSRCDDLWKRRSSIICQLRRKADTDLSLLYDCIEPSLHRPEFFLRKAIGWALRDLAHFDPHEVRGYVEAHRGRLSPLSLREATKHLEVSS